MTFPLHGSDGIFGHIATLGTLNRDTDHRKATDSEHSILRLSDLELLHQFQQLTLETFGTTKSKRIFKTEFQRRALEVLQQSDIRSSP